ncbi:MAG: hypothetical protein ABI625_04100 [bacterium]
MPSNISDVEVSATIQNVDWQRALTQLLTQASLIARTDADGVMRVSVSVSHQQ